MADAYSRALGDAVVLAARHRGMSHREIEERSGVDERSFRRYFVKVERAAPLKDVVAVAEALGMPTSDLLRQAEQLLTDTPET